MLVNNAGVLAQRPIADASPEDFRRVIDINLTGVYLGTRAVLPSMREAGSGSIVNISSTAGLQGYAHLGAYVASTRGCGDSPRPPRSNSVPRASGSTPSIQGRSRHP